MLVLAQDQETVVNFNRVELLQITDEGWDDPAQPVYDLQVETTGDHGVALARDLVKADAIALRNLLVEAWLDEAQQGKPLALIVDVAELLEGIANAKEGANAQ